MTSQFPTITSGCRKREADWMPDKEDRQQKKVKTDDPSPFANRLDSRYRNRILPLAAASSMPQIPILERGVAARPLIPRAKPLSSSEILVPTRSFFHETLCPSADSVLSHLPLPAAIPKIHLGNFKLQKSISLEGASNPHAFSDQFVTLSPDGHFLAFPTPLLNDNGEKTNDVSVQILNIENLSAPKKSLGGFSRFEFPSSIVFDSSASFLFVGRGDGRLEKWNLNTKKRIFVSSICDRANPLLSRIHALAFGNNQVFVGNGEGSLFRIDAATGAFDAVDIFDDHYEKITCIAISPNGRFLATAGSGNRLVIYDLKDDMKKIDRYFVRGGIRSIAFHPEGKPYLAFGGGATDNQPVLGFIHIRPSDEQPNQGSPITSFSLQAIARGVIWPKEDLIFLAGDDKTLRAMPLSFEQGVKKGTVKQIADLDGVPFFSGQQGNQIVIAGKNQCQIFSLAQSASRPSLLDLSTSTVR